VRPIRVAVVARSIFPLHGYGGLERHVYDLVRHLSARDVRVTLVTRPPTHECAHERASGAAKIRFVPYRTFPFAGRRGTTILDRSTAYPLFGLRAGRLAGQLVRRGEVDLVHGLGASVLGYALERRTAGAPLVLNPQGLEEFGATDPSRARLKRLAYLPLRIAVRRSARAADCVIATDRALEPAVFHHLGIPRARIRVIPNAIDLDVIDQLAGVDDGARVRKAAGLASSELVLLSAGRLEASKGFHVLIQALSAVRAHTSPLSDNSWRWVLVGDGPYRRRLEQMIAEARLQQNVLMPGRLNDPALHAWYEAATLFVHPTLYEGSSIVTLEAMAHRRAVVATNAGGLPDKVRTGVNGWLVEPGQPDALAAALSGALSEPSRLEAMGAAGRGIVEREFSWTSVTTKLLELYDELLRR
jgi:glycosyltransferase involved in cell wall biosynthesis